ncbi:MAG: hypothetical protein R2745_08945 [Vicinamibacterales bacterium]
MSQRLEFHRLSDPGDGLKRVLAPGLVASTYPGAHAMLSIADVEPNAEGTVHRHPEQPLGLP